MDARELRALMEGIVVGLKKAEELFRESTDARGGCKVMSKGDNCKCFLCLCDNELAKVHEELKTR